MDLRSLSVLAAILALAAAGCITPSTAEVDAADLALDLPLAQALWADPQNAPHPAFGWPTLTHPAADPPSPWWAPAAAAELPASITGIQQLVRVEGVAAGAGIALFGSLAVVPGYGDVSYVVDISDPTAPAVLSEFEPTQGSHRGAVIVAYPDGRLVTALATGAGFEVWDITDPRMPAHLADVEPTEGGHKLGVVPGTPIVYNANSEGGGSLSSAPRLAGAGSGITEIYDLSDPASPVHVQDFENGYGCHHIFFWNSEEKQRAICAGIEFAQIWDVSDPLAPVVIANVPIPQGAAGTPSPSLLPGITPFAHFSVLNDDGTILVVGDELGGGSTPPGCTAGADTPVVDNGAPTGALWFYDVSDETSPQLLGWYSPGHHVGPDVRTSCTAHHGRLVPDPEGRDLLAMSFYGAGVVLLDFSDPKLPQIVDQFYDGSDTWETWYYNGYLFTGDLARGMDVLSFE